MHYFTFLSFFSTSDGESYPNHSARYNTTGWSSLTGGENASVHTFYKWSLWVETIETSYGGYWVDLGKVENYKYNEWNAMCVTVDHEAGKQTVFVNGEYVDEKLVEDYKLVALQKKINKTFSPKDHRVTDVFLGCWPFLVECRLGSFYPGKLV